MFGGAGTRGHHAPRAGVGTGVACAVTEPRVLPGNVLFITVDQWRGDCLGALGHPVVRTPNLDRLAAEGVLFRRHFAQAAPCGPSRASLHTGMYLMNHRSVLNGTPLDARFTNVALEARGARLRPGAVRLHRHDADPRDARARRPAPAHLRGRAARLPRRCSTCPSTSQPWGAWLREPGLRRARRRPRDVRAGLRTRPGAPVAYAAEHTETAFLTGELLDYVDDARRRAVVRARGVHPAAPAVRRARAVQHDVRPGCGAGSRCGTPTFEAEGAAHPLLAGAVLIPGVRGPTTTPSCAQLRATYYGMMTEVDAQLGRLFDGLRERGAWDDTLVVLTSDHGEQLGDHWLTEKLGWFDQSYHVPLHRARPAPRRRRDARHASSTTASPRTST